MKRGLISLSLIFLIVISLVLASCSSSTNTIASTTTASATATTTNSTTATSTTIIVSTSTPSSSTTVTATTTSTGNWWDSLGTPIYGGTLTDHLTQNVASWDPYLGAAGQADLFLIWKHCLWVIIQLPLLSGTSQHLGYLHNLPPVV